MTRIKQFANDMGLSYNEAKNLVNKGRRLKDGGSSTLEKFMPTETVKTKKKKKKGFKVDPVKPFFEIPEGMEEEFNPRGGGRQRRPAKVVKPVRAKNGKVTRINKDKSMQAKSGQFKNIVNASVSKQITPEEAQKKIRKLILSKSDGGTNKVKQMPKKHKLEKYLTKEEIKKIGPMGTELLLKVQEGVMKGRGKKDGGVLKELPPASENPGLRKLPTEVRNKMGFKKKGGTMKMMGGGMYDMKPKNMSGGGVARGTGAAVKGTGFKGVY